MWDYSDHKAPTQFICALGQLRSTYKKSPRFKHLAFFHREEYKQLPRGQTETLGCEAILDFLRKFKRLQSAGPFLNLSVWQGFRLQSLVPPTEFDKPLSISHLVLSGEKLRMGNVASDPSRRCTECTSVFIRKLQGLCYETGGTAEMSENVQDITHKIASGGRPNCAFPVLAKQSGVELVTLEHISVSVSQKHFKDLNV